MLFLYLPFGCIRGQLSAALYWLFSASASTHGIYALLASILAIYMALMAPQIASLFSVCSYHFTELQSLQRLLEPPQRFEPCIHYLRHLRTVTSSALHLSPSECTVWPHSYTNTWPSRSPVWY